MRRQTELKTVHHETPERTTLKSVPSGNREAQPVTTIERSILSTLNEMERMMEETFHRPLLSRSILPFRHLLRDLGSYGDITPSIDIFEEGGNVVLKAELPGIKREDVNVKFVENNIVISGEKKTEGRVEEKDYLRLERSHGTFNRMLSLPDGVNTDKAKATFKDGVLEVRIPKTEGRSAVRQVTVE